MSSTSSVPGQPRLPSMDDRSTPAPPPLVASKIHLMLLLLFLLGLAAAGYLAQHRALSAPANPASAVQLADHSQAIRFYLTALVVDWILFFVCFAGIYRKGGTLASITGGRWQSVKESFSIWASPQCSGCSGKPSPTAPTMYSTRLHRPQMRLRLRPCCLSLP